MPEATIFINGKEITAEAGSNLLEVALQNGIEIPHLCYDPRLKPFGACRLCFVEAGGPRGPVPACATAVVEGMRVETDSEPLRDLKKTALELLLSEHCGDCIAPCQLACPAHIDIQGYIAYLDRGEYKQAADLIKEKMPLPSICGRVCPRFCEEQCRRVLVDEPVNICDLKRFAGDFDLRAVNSYQPSAAADTGKEVAVVGGGPAGLTAAYFLALAGHRVTLYDRGPKLGGMLRYGIPEYRLPKALLDKEIQLIADLCREVHLGVELGKDFTLEELKERYDAVFVGIGCQSAQGMGLEKEELPGILKGIDFLRQVEEGSPPELGRRVAVVGGGNTAMDAARTALRLGVEEVYLLYRRSRHEMPANPVEIEEAEEEGVCFYYLTNPVSVLGEDCVTGVECVRMELGDPDAGGRRRPIVIEGSSFKLELDNVIMAIGQSLDLDQACACSLDPSGKRLAACEDTGCTPVDGVFAAGDAVTGPATVVEAVGAARKAALAIDLYLKGADLFTGITPYTCSMGALSDLDPALFAQREKLPRSAGRHLPPAVRKLDFREYNLGLNETEAMLESKRCLACGCQDVFECKLKDYATAYLVDTKLLGVEKPRYPISDDHPLIRRDPNKCILCANCVRICQEVQEANALCLVNRGYETVVKPYLGLPLSETSCESCGQCVSACPTGALSAKGPFEKPGPWQDDRVVRSVCLQCGIGCAIDWHVTANKISRVTSPLRQEINDGNLCVKGVFEYSAGQCPARLHSPLVREGRALKECGWEEALTKAAAGLKQVKERFGAGSLAVLLSPLLSCEEIHLAVQLAKQGLGSVQIESLDPAAGGAVLLDSRPPSYRSVSESDLVVIVEADLPEDYPILAQKVRKGLDRGACLAVIAGRSTRLDRRAGQVVPINPGMIREVLQGFLAFLAGSDGAESFAAADRQEALRKLPQALRANLSGLAGIAADFRKAKNPVFIVDGQGLGAFELNLLKEALRLAGKEKQGAVLPLFRGGNARGFLELGVGAGPAYKDNDVHSAERAIPRIMAGVKSDKIKGLLVIGDGFKAEADLGGKDLFVVALTSRRSEGLESAANIVLPAAAFAETGGTAINCEGRLQMLKPALFPPAGKYNWMIIRDLAAALGVPLKVETLEDITGEIIKSLEPNRIIWEA